MTALRGCHGRFHARKQCQCVIPLNRLKFLQSLIALIVC